MVGGWKDGASNSVAEGRMLGACGGGVAAAEMASAISGRMLVRCILKARYLRIFDILRRLQFNEYFLDYVVNSTNNAQTYRLMSCQY